MREYFQHDYNARNSLQLQALMGKCGESAYGIFWAIVELLHEKKNKVPLKQYVYSGIADQIKTTPEKVESVIRFCIEFELFSEKNGFFSSTRVKGNIVKRLSISKLRAKSGKHGASVKQNLAKERKEKEKKGNDVDTTPPDENAIVLFNAEKEILTNHCIWFEQLCMRMGKGLEDGKRILREFHLYKVEKEHYPMSKKQACAGFERWIGNEKKFTAPGKKNEETSSPPLKRI